MTIEGEEIYNDNDKRVVKEAFTSTQITIIKQGKLSLQMDQKDIVSYFMDFVYLSIPDRKKYGLMGCMPYLRDMKAERLVTRSDSIFLFVMKGKGQVIDGDGKRTNFFMNDLIVVPSMIPYSFVENLDLPVIFILVTTY